MVSRKKQPDKWTVLSWDDLNDWAGERIVGRGRNYQRQGRVSDLSLEQDGGLLAWVDGSRRYATHVVLNPGGLPTSHCTCPYESDCKHAVAAVLEYLKRVENGQRVSKAAADDDRSTLLADEEADDELLDDSDGLAEDRLQQIETFLKAKTKAQLVELLRDIADQHPEVAQDLRDRQHLDSGKVPKLVASLRREIRDAAEEPGWQNYWDGEGYTPDYSGIRKKIDNLLKAGHADEMLELGRELLISGTRQVEESHDEGETAMEIAGCMPLIARGLDRSSLPAADKLAWALDAVLDDPYDLCDAFVEYLLREHPESAKNGRLWPLYRPRILCAPRPSRRFWTAKKRPTRSRHGRRCADICLATLKPATSLGTGRAGPYRNPGWTVPNRTGADRFPWSKNGLPSRSLKKSRTRC